MSRQLGLACLVLFAVPTARGQAVAMLVRPEQVGSVAVGWLAPSPRPAGEPASEADNPHLALTSTGRAEDACTVCHTPLQEQGAAAAWAGPAMAVAPYTSATTDLPAAPTPGPQTTLCLACHDGISGSSHGAVAGQDSDPAAEAAGLGWLTRALGGGRATARDPRGEHPVAIRYVDGLDAKLHPRALVEAAGLPFYGPLQDQLECTTCHDPHRNTAHAYLRMSNERSRLCLSCHDK